MSISCEVTSALIDLALREDVGENLQTGDVTSAYFVPQDSISSAYIYAKQEGVLAGMEVAAEVFHRVNPELKVVQLKKDGDPLSQGERVLDDFDSRAHGLKFPATLVWSCHSDPCVCG